MHMQEVHGGRPALSPSCTPRPPRSRPLGPAPAGPLGGCLRVSGQEEAPAPPSSPIHTCPLEIQRAFCSLTQIPSSSLYDTKFPNKGPIMFRVV